MNSAQHTSALRAEGYDPSLTPAQRVEIEREQGAARREAARQAGMAQARKVLAEMEARHPLSKAGRKRGPTPNVRRGRDE